MDKRSSLIEGIMGTPQITAEQVAVEDKDFREVIDTSRFDVQLLITHPLYVEKVAKIIHHIPDEGDLRIRAYKALQNSNLLQVVDMYSQLEKEPSNRAIRYNFRQEYWKFIDALDSLVTQSEICDLNRTYLCFAFHKVFSSVTSYDNSDEFGEEVFYTEPTPPIFQFIGFIGRKILHLLPSKS